MYQDNIKCSSTLFQSPAALGQLLWRSFVLPSQEKKARSRFNTLK